MYNRRQGVLIALGEMMIFLVLWVLAVGCALIHIGARRLWRHPLERAIVFLLYQLTVSLGLAGLLVFIGHALRPAETAARIGWPTAPNFQFELGAVGMGMAIASALSLFVRYRHYWLGVALGPSVFMALAGINHLREGFEGNLAPYNVGIVAPDLLIPAGLAWLLHRVFKLAPKGSE